MWMQSALVTVALAVAGSAAPLDAAKHKAEIEQWRVERVERLKQPDGWLSLVGLHWLAEGKQTVGSGKDNDVVLAVGPARLGTITLADKKLSIQLAEGAEAKVGETDARQGELAPDSSGAPTFVTFGNAQFQVIERWGKYALRVKDADAATRTGFLGIDYYDIDPTWRFEARFEPHPPGKTIEIANIVGTVEPMPNPGALVFEKDGKTHRIEAVDEGDEMLFLIFADRTSGNETYGAGRFLYAAPPAAGSSTVIVDFNAAYNPPCVFTPYATCPLAPPENRLDLAVTSGERKYRGAAH